MAAQQAENVAWLHRRFVAYSEEREHFATAVALAHSARDATPEPAIVLLANACKDPAANSSRFEGLGWDMAGETMPREALVAAGDTALRALPVLLEALKSTDEAVDASFLLEDALAIVFGLENRERPPSRLDEHQRQVLRAALDSPIVWQQPNLFTGIFAYYKFPPSRQELIAFLAA